MNEKIKTQKDARILQNIVKVATYPVWVYGFTGIDKHTKAPTQINTYVQSFLYQLHSNAVVKWSYQMSLLICSQVLSLNCEN